MTLPIPLVSVGALAEALPPDDVVVLDCSWYLPSDGRDAEAEFLSGHIPGAQRFDFDVAVAACDTHQPHMPPDADVFERAARDLGISETSTVVCYDGAGIFAAPRAWWMFRAMGHRKVAVLDGGWPAWSSSGHPVETGSTAPRGKGDFVARPDPGWVRDAAAVRSALGDPRIAVIDARSVLRFSGKVAEPRPGLRSGAMPGATNLPFGDLVSDGHMRSIEELDARLAQAGATGDRAVVATCGSGVTAAVVAFAATLAGRTRVAVYDGSWAEWGDERRQDLPVVRSAEADAPPAGG